MIHAFCLHTARGVPACQRHAPTACSYYGLHSFASISHDLQPSLPFGRQLLTTAGGALMPCGRGAYPDAAVSPGVEVAIAISHRGTFLRCPSAEAKPMFIWAVEKKKQQRASRILRVRFGRISTHLLCKREHGENEMKVLGLMHFPESRAAIGGRSGPHGCLAPSMESSHRLMCSSNL